MPKRTANPDGLVSEVELELAEEGLVAEPEIGPVYPTVPEPDPEVPAATLDPGTAPEPGIIAGTLTGVLTGEIVEVDQVPPELIQETLDLDAWEQRLMKLEAQLSQQAEAINARTAELLARSRSAEEEVDDEDEAPKARTPRERGFHETRDREAQGFLSVLQGAVRSAGVPGVWVKVVGVALPVLSTFASSIARALHEDSPGGKRLKREELDRAVRRAAKRLERELLEAFLAEVS